MVTAQIKDWKKETGSFGNVKFQFHSNSNCEFLCFKIVKLALYLKYILFIIIKHSNGKSNFCGSFPICCGNDILGMT